MPQHLVGYLTSYHRTRRLYLITHHAIIISPSKVQVTFSCFKHESAIEAQSECQTTAQIGVLIIELYFAARYSESKIAAKYLNLILRFHLFTTNITRFLSTLACMHVDSGIKVLSILATEK